MYTGKCSQYYNANLHKSSSHQSENLTTTSNISIVYSENKKIGAIELSHFQFKDNTKRSVDIVKTFEAKYRDYFCTNLKQLIIHLENSKSIDDVIDACNSFNKNISNETYNDTSLNGITLSVNTNADFDSSKSNLITELKSLLASYQEIVLEKQEKTKPNIELKENNAFFRFFNSVIKRLTKFIRFFQQGRMLNRLYEVIDKKKSLNDTELTSLINNLNHTYLNKALLYSADQGRNIEIIDMLIKAGADINAKDKFNQTALIRALSEDRYATTKKLLEYSPDVNAVTISGNTALTFAASRKLNNNYFTDKIIYEIFDKIIDKSSKEVLIGKQHKGYNPLHYAIMYGNLYAVKKLLEKNVLVNGNCKIGSCDNQGNALHLIMNQNDIDIGTRLEITKELLDAEIDIYIKDGNGRTALELVKLKASSCQDYEPIVELLQENYELNKLYNVINKRGKDLNKKKLTKLINNLNQSSLDKALMYSAQEGKNIETIDILVKTGANINTKCKNNETPLMRALKNGQYATAQKLLTYNPEVDTISKEGATTLIHAIRKAPSDGSANKIINKLIEKSSKETLSHVSTKGNTALHYAVNFNNLDAVKELLKKDVPLNGCCKYNNDFTGSALHISILSRAIDTKTKLEITKLLLDAEIDTNIKDGNGKTALECSKLIASRHQDYKPLVELLQENHELNKLYNVINKSKDLNKTELINLIRKLTPSSLDKALMYSAQQDNVEILSMLVEAGANINTKNQSNATLLIKAIAWGRYNTAKKLLEYLPETEVNTVTTDGYTALMFAVGSKLNNNGSDNILYELIEKIIDKSNNETLNLQDSKGNTAMYYALSQGNLYAITELMKKNIADDSKKMP